MALKAFAASGRFARYADRANATITADVLNKGMVLVYFTSYTNNLNQWTPLPLSFVMEGYSYNYYYILAPGSIRLLFFLSRISADPPNVSTIVMPSYKFKVVSVSGQLATQLRRLRIPTDNYAAVSDFLHLK